jgi:peptidyl-prolyl cis-trans isomerase SDCCAG10
MLAKFQSMIGEQKLKKGSQKESSVGNVKDDQSWLAHELICQKEDDPVLAKDANMRNEEDWFDIYDPRNPINKRRREEGLVKEDKLKKRKD